MTEPPGPRVPSDDLSSLRVPKALRADVAEIAVLIDEVCVEHLDDEYASLSLRLLAKLARKRPSLHWRAASSASGRRLSST